MADVGEEGVSTFSTLGFIWIRRAWIFLNLATLSSFWLVSGGVGSEDDEEEEEEEEEEGGDKGGEEDEAEGGGERDVGEAGERGVVGSDSLILLEGGGCG